MIIAIHWVLAIILFYLINYLGKESTYIGYSQITLSSRSEEAPAFNFLIRVLGPVVYLILISTLLYALSLDKLVSNIYLVSVYYISFRLLYNSILMRQFLVNWVKQIVYWVSTLLLSYITYQTFIKTKHNIIPDFTTIANELWILIAIYMYSVINNLKISSTVIDKKRDKYLTNMYELLKVKFNNIIQNLLDKPQLVALAYSILIVENFNRPVTVRMVERLLQRITRKTYTIGIMQVRSSISISDEKSVEMGCQMLKSNFDKFVTANTSSDYYSEWQLINDLIQSYNHGEEYFLDVRNIYSFILEKFYPNSQDIVSTPQYIDTEILNESPDNHPYLQ